MGGKKEIKYPAFITGNKDKTITERKVGARK